MTREDRGMNWLALQHGLRIVSLYRGHAADVYIVTEPDRSSTTILTGEDMDGL